MTNDNKIITAPTANELFAQLNTDFAVEDGFYEYTATLVTGNVQVLLDIDIDPGGGFESGYETTMLRSELTTTAGFRFAIHHESFLDDLGKFFGMQDVEIGYPEFDEKVIVKTNNEAKVKSLFIHQPVRQVFETLDNYTFGITSHRKPHSDEKQYYLELIIETGITNTTELQKIYHAFVEVLSRL